LEQLCMLHTSEMLKLSAKLCFYARVSATHSPREN
jgi:hypothetical protein